MLYILSSLFAFVYVADCQCIALWQWQCGILAVFLSWINLLIFIAKLPLSGLYVIMLIRVFTTFLKVVLLSSLLVVAFGISFYMAFREPAILVSSSYVCMMVTFILASHMFQLCSYIPPSLCIS